MSQQNHVRAEVLNLPAYNNGKSADALSLVLVIPVRMGKCIRNLYKKVELLLK
jgi:hypothetical protein